jgi:hypothetical protein
MFTLQEKLKDLLTRAIRNRRYNTKKKKAKSTVKVKSKPARGQKRGYALDKLIIKSNLTMIIL